MPNSTPGAIFIPGNVPSSKNTKSAFKVRSKKTGKERLVIVGSKLSKDWVALTENDWREKRDSFLKLLDGKVKPYMIGFQFVRSSRRKFDYINPAQTVQDAMVKHCWLFDDNADEIVPVFLPYTYDKENPGVYIHVL